VINNSSTSVQSGSTTIQAESFLLEYSSGAAVRKYTRATAGYGISYLLDNDYKNVYLQALRHLPSDMREQGMRVLEFGCGGGMNLLHLVSLLQREGIPVRQAVGSDFSPILIQAAQQEAKRGLSPEQQGIVKFCVASNESLVHDLSAEFSTVPSTLKSSFHFIVGVNTIRYCHRAGTQLDCARDILELLAPGGICVVIDMNNRYPLFRSALRDRLQKRREEYWLPSLEQHASPFQELGFKIIRKGHFCWIPHSAGRLVCAFFRLLSPLLDRTIKSRAIRSLVVCQKPPEGEIK
jgi:SAM-dependent methyltransferase